MEEAASSYLSWTQREALGAVSARLIPSDQLGPGAREAGVVRYVDRSLATDYREYRVAYDEGLAALDECATRRFDRPFVELEAPDQDAVLQDFESGAAESGLADEAGFFELVRKHVIEGMFGDPAWGGNEGLVGWKLLGYPGPRLVWTAEEQRLDHTPAEEDRGAPIDLRRTDGGERRG